MGRFFVIEGEKVLALVPARGGSKGIPHKNLQKIKGRSLIEWTFLSAQKVSYIDTLALSTEDPQVASTAQKIGYKVIHRPPELASDTSPTMDCVLHALDLFPDHSWLLLLQATSPLRNPKDIQLAIELCIQKKAPSCVSVCPVHHHPHFMVSLEGSSLKPAFSSSSREARRRQDLSSLYAINGAIYFASAIWLRKTKSFIHSDTDISDTATDTTTDTATTADTAITTATAINSKIPTQAYIMPQSRSLDIDTFEDLHFAEALISLEGQQGRK